MPVMGARQTLWNAIMMKDAELSFQLEPSCHQEPCRRARHRIPVGLGHGRCALRMVVEVDDSRWVENELLGDLGRLRVKWQPRPLCPPLRFDLI